MVVVAVLQHVVDEIVEAEEWRWAWVAAGSVPAGIVLLGAFVGGVQLLCRRMRLNDNLAFSALASSRCKHFVRPRIDDKGELTVFVVGLDPIGKGWWRRMLLGDVLFRGHLATELGRASKSGAVVPLAFTREAFAATDLFADRSVVRLFDLPDGERAEAAVIAVLARCVRKLGPADSVRVFLSHAKADGAGIAKRLERSLSEVGHAAGEHRRSG